MKEQKHNNFLRISNDRKKRIIDLLKSLNDLTNTTYYEYKDIEIKELFNEIEQQTRESKTKLLNANIRPKGFDLDF